MLTYCRVPFIQNVQNRPIHRAGEPVRGTRGWGVEDAEWINFLFRVMGMFWYHIMVMVAQPCKYAVNHLIIGFKMVI